MTDAEVEEFCNQHNARRRVAIINSLCQQRDMSLEEATAFFDSDFADDEGDSSICDD